SLGEPPMIEQLTSQAPATIDMQPTRATHASLLLADGTCFHGQGLGVPASVSGELIFTTAMTGYQEALTDPSYRGQILMFTYPLIGNYGVSVGRAQSEKVHARAAIVSTLSDTWSEPDSLRSYLLNNGV